MDRIIQHASANRPPSLLLSERQREGVTLIPRTFSRFKIGRLFAGQVAIQRFDVTPLRSAATETETGRALPACHSRPCFGPRSSGGIARARRTRTVPRSLCPTGTESRKREIGFMGLVLGGRAVDGGRREGERGPAACWKTLSWNRAEKSKAVTVQSKSLLASLASTDLY